MNLTRKCGKYLNQNKWHTKVNNVLYTCVRDFHAMLDLVKQARSRFVIVTWPKRNNYTFIHSDFQENCKQLNLNADSSFKRNLIKMF